MDLVIVTGLSGAGRHSVLEALEDRGFTALDNLPVRMLDPLIELEGRLHPGASMAVGMDSRHEDFAARKRTDKAAMRRLGDFAVDRFGDPFASGEILKIAARIMLGRTRVKTPRRLAPRDEFICSEYVAKCFEAVGIEIAWGGAGFVAPADFARDPKMHAVARFKT